MKNLSDDQSDHFFMAEAIKEAEKAFLKNEVPVGAVLVKEGSIIARAHNEVEFQKKSLAHAEILCLSIASEFLNNWRLSGTTLYVTLEPCSMCLGAIILSRVKKVVFAAPDIRHGACGSWVNLVESKHPIHQVEIKKGILQTESSELLKKFFRERRIQNGKTRKEFRSAQSFNR
jgi:tRNA(adenine34) deaminase